MLFIIITMKKNISKSSFLFLVFFSIFILGGLQSCKHTNSKAVYIPKSSKIVAKIQPMQLIKKAPSPSVFAIANYRKQLLQVVEENSYNYVVIETLLNNPLLNGIAITEDIYYYLLKNKDKHYNVLQVSLKKRKTFKNFLEDILNDNYDLVHHKKFDYYSNEDNSWIAFNNDVALFISSPVGRTSEIEQILHTIFAAEESNSVVQRADFDEFNNKKSDISVFLPMQEIIGELRTFSSMQQYDFLQKDLEKSSNQVFIDFKKGKIEARAETVLSDSLRQFLLDYNYYAPFSSTAIHSMLPKDYIVYMQTGINLRNVVKLLSLTPEYASLTNMLAMQGIYIEEFVSALSGNLAVHVQNISQSDVSKNNASILISLEREQQLKSILRTILPANPANTNEPLYDMTPLMGFPFFIDIYEKTLILTTNKSVITSVKNVKNAESILTDKVVKNNAKESVCILNLNIDSYPPELQTMLKTYIDSQAYTLLNSLESLVLTSDALYEGRAELTSKDNSKNSLALLLELTQEFLMK